MIRRPGRRRRSGKATCLHASIRVFRVLYLQDGAPAPERRADTALHRCRSRDGRSGVASCPSGASISHSATTEGYAEHGDRSRRVQLRQTGSSVQTGLGRRRFRVRRPPAASAPSAPELRRWCQSPAAFSRRNAAQTSGWRLRRGRLCDRKLLRRPPSAGGRPLKCHESAVDWLVERLSAPQTRPRYERPRET